MNKTFKKLVLSFSVAATTLLGLAPAAQAQSVPVNVTATQTVSQNADLVTNHYISDDVVNAVGQLPMNSTMVFPYARQGFTTARVDQTGENVGVQYKIENGTRTPIAAFNLDDPSGQQLFDAAVAQARARNTPPVVVVAGPTYVTPSPIYLPTYTYVRHTHPVVLYGPVFRPYMHHHHDRPIVVIRQGNDWRNPDRWRDNDRYRDRDHDRDRGRDHDRGRDGRVAFPRGPR